MKLGFFVAYVEGMAIDVVSFVLSQYFNYFKNHRQTDGSGEIVELLELVQEEKVVYKEGIVFVHKSHMFNYTMHLTVKTLQIQSLIGIGHQVSSIVQRAVGTWSRQQTAVQVHRRLRTVIPKDGAKLLWCKTRASIQQSILLLYFGTRPRLLLGRSAHMNNNKQLGQGRSKCLWHGNQAKVMTN